MRFRPAHHALAPPVPDDRLRWFRTWPVETIEWSRWQVVVELSSVGSELRLQAIEHFFGKAARIFLCLHHQRRHSANDRRLRHTLVAMTAEITHHLAAAGRMADVNRIPQVEMIGDGLQIIGIVVHVVSATGLSRATMSAPISRNDAKTFAEEKKHVSVPIIRRERPAVTEHNRLSFAPIFIIDINVRSVFFSDSDVWHFNFPFGLGLHWGCAARGQMTHLIFGLTRRFVT